MNDEIVLSVIVPVFNTEKYLEQCIESVLIQGIKGLEIICIDDGSTDRSSEILETYAKNNKSIKVYHQTNKGAGAARNLGLRISTGKYVHFLDSDDWIAEGIYATILKKMDSLEADVYMFQYTRYDNQEASYQEVDPFKNHAKVDPGDVVFFENNERFFFFNAVVPWNKIYLREFLNENHLNFDEIYCANDCTFYFHMLLCNPRIILDYGHYMFYRVNNPMALTGINRSINFDCHIKSFENIWLLYKNENDKIKSLLLGVSLRDFIGFYRKSTGEGKWYIYKRLHEYFKDLDMTLLEKDINKYSWYPEYKMIKESPYFLGEANPTFTLNDKELEALKRKCNSLAKERDKYKKACADLQKENNNLQSFLQKRKGVHKILTAIKYCRKNGIWCTLDQIFLKLFDTNSRRIGLMYGVTKNKRKQKLIISLTSFPDRIKSIDQCIISLLSQSVKPDLLILWLADSQFPGKEKDLPVSLRQLKKYGLQIRWCEDLRSYKKLIPTLKLFPEDIIVTADDDNIYNTKWLELMYSAYLKWPLHIHCHRVTKFYYNNSEKHFDIITGGKEFYKKPNFMNKQVGLGGVLYPPHCFHHDVLKAELFMKLAPTSDDIWFWLMAVLNNVRVNVVPKNIARANYIPGTQEGPSLTHINDHGEKLFWVHFQNMLNAYPALEKKLIDEQYWA